MTLRKEFGKKKPSEQTKKKIGTRIEEKKKTSTPSKKSLGKTKKKLTLHVKIEKLKPV